MRKPLLTLGLVAATALALPAFAQDSAPVGTDTAATAEAGAPAENRAEDRADGQRPDARKWHGKRDRDGRRGHDQRRMGHGDHGSGPAMMLRMVTAGFDSDGDGEISEQELTDGLAALVERHDADGDGTLSLDEFATLHAEIIRPMTVRAFQFLDRDGDGQINAEERQKAEQMLNRRVTGKAQMRRR